MIREKKRDKQVANYLSCNWKPLAVGVAVGFMLRELMFVVAVFVVVFCIIQYLGNKDDKSVGG